MNAKQKIASQLYTDRLREHLKTLRAAMMRARKVLTNAECECGFDHAPEEPETSCYRCEALSALGPRK